MKYVHLKLSIRKATGKILLVLVTTFLGATIFAQTFSTKGGIIEDATEESFSRGLYPISVKDLPKSIECNGFGLSSVCINIQHARLSDLKVTLLSPDGTEVWLTNRNGHYSKSYSSTCFSMTAAGGFIYNASSNFFGTFIPDGNLNNINNNQNPNGVWYIAIEDLQEGEFGFFTEFVLTFSNEVPCDPSICELDSISNCECPNQSQDTCILLPDLIVLEKNTKNHIKYFPSSNSQYPNQLRFSASMANIGHGPLEVIPIEEYFCDEKKITDPFECKNGVLSQSINQRVYQKRGNKYEIKFHKANSWYFDSKRGHNHYHVEGWTDFKLLEKKWWTKNPKKWRVVSESSKVSYCLMDSNICLEEEANCSYDGKTFTRKNLSNFGLGSYFQCDQSQQGISVGAVDNYGMFYEGQFIDLPYHLKDGTYYLYINVDPYNYYLEENEDNNMILLQLKFEHGKMEVIS